MKVPSVTDRKSYIALQALTSAGRGEVRVGAGEHPHPGELHEKGEPEQPGHEAVLSPAAVRLVGPIGLDPHRLVHPEEGEDPPQDGVAEARVAELEALLGDGMRG